MGPIFSAAHVEWFSGDATVAGKFWSISHMIVPGFPELVI